MRRTARDLFTEYGTAALVVYLTIFAAVFAAFWLGLRLGWQSGSTAGNVGTLAAAYVGAKATQPLRIAATVVLTPVVARLYERLRLRSRPTPGTASEESGPGSPPS